MIAEDIEEVVVAVVSVLRVRDFGGAFPVSFLEFESRAEERLGFVGSDAVYCAYVEVKRIQVVVTCNSSW